MITFVAWLSITFSFGVKPFDFRYSKFCLYAARILGESRPGIGVARMAFVS